MIDTIANTRNMIEKGVIKVEPSPEIESALKGLREFMFENIYRGPVCKAERVRAAFIIEHLFEYYCKHPAKMSRFMHRLLRKRVCKRQWLIIFRV